MFLHEFGEDFVLALQLLFQQGDPPVLVVAGAAGAVLECGSGVLEELLLPTVEHRGVNAVLVAQIRHRGVFEEMEPKYGDLLRGAEAIPSFLGHGKTSARDCSLFERLVLPIPTEAKHGPFLREDQCEVFGGKNLAQTEIQIGLLSLVQAKDLVPQSGRGRVCHERPPCRLNVSCTDIESSTGGLLSIPIPDSRHRVETYS